MTRADIIEAMAKTDALFDGRIRKKLSELGQADRQRYLDRSAYGLEAIGKLAAVVERVPTDSLITSMSMRYDHGLFAPLQTSLGQTEESRARKIEATAITMRQLHEEVVGTGFYRNADLTKPAVLDNPFHVRPPALKQAEGGK